jgi:hypothetical protein
MRARSPGRFPKKVSGHGRGLCEQSSLAMAVCSQMPVLVRPWPRDLETELTK